ncbi:hypothetical protein BC332_03826 [Capsicum chinense]|nr:hypothetical protein BC332_03826 [Capsicum chinense]
MAKGRKKVANKIQISAAPVKANPRLGKTIAVHTSPGQKLDKEPSLTPPILLEARSASKEYVVILSIFRGWKLCRPELRTADLPPPRSGPKNVKHIWHHRGNDQQEVQGSKELVNAQPVQGGKNANVVATQTSMESVVIMNAFTDYEWTKVKGKSASKAPALFSPHDSIINEWENNYAANGKGRIWLLWNPGNVQVTVLHTENQIIHSFIIDHSKSHLIAFSAIYELHTIEERKELWASIENLESSIHNAWLLMGDFNANLRGKDRNTTVMDAEIRDFENLMTNSGLHKLKTIGRFFTWTNSYVHSKLDKALVNGVWLRKWPHLEVEVTHFSGHSLLYVSVKEV